MKHLVLAFFVCAALATVAIAGCNTSTGPTLANLVGTHDMVVVDSLPGDGTIARPGNPDAGLVGVPNRYIFITSADTNELRVLSNYRDGFTDRRFLSAPNPLETLSVPVLDRPTMLAVDEGLGDDGRRVTGRLVYAARAGGAELSIVDARDDASGMRQITSTPLPLPAPATTLATWLGAGLTTLPDTTQLFVGTWDGAVGSVFLYQFVTERSRLAEVAQVKPVRLIDFPNEAVIAVRVLPPLAGRTADGQPFCATNVCLALATRREEGRAGRAVLFDPTSKRMVALAYPGPIREFSSAPDGQRLYGVLDEELCTTASCGGLIAVDTKSAVDAGFPVMTDFSGRPMVAIPTGTTLPRGVSIGVDNPTYRLSIQQTVQVYDGGAEVVGLGAVGYAQLGVFSNANGEFAIFDPISGVPLDFDERRPKLVSSVLQQPLALADGGYAYFNEDGGSNYTADFAAIARVDDGTTDLIRSWDLSIDGGAPLVNFKVSDGVLVSQDFTATYSGVIPGFDSLPTSLAAGSRLAFTTGKGLEARVLPGDRVVFGMPDLDGGVATCGVSPVSSVDADAGVLVVGAVTGCDARTTYSVRAAAGLPVVVAGSVEGYLGRMAPGGTMAYNRRFVVEPRQYDGVNREALLLTLYSIPAIPGAYWTFSLTGYLNTYRVELDSTTLGCSAFVPGRLFLGMIPRYVNAVTAGFPWSVMALLPSSNAIVEMPLAHAFDNSLGRMTTTDTALCWK